MQREFSFFSESQMNSVRGGGEDKPFAMLILHTTLVFLQITLFHFSTSSSDAGGVLFLYSGRSLADFVCLEAFLCKY